MYFGAVSVGIRVFGAHTCTPVEHVSHGDCARSPVCARVCVCLFKPCTINHSHSTPSTRTCRCRRLENQTMSHMRSYDRRRRASVRIILVLQRPRGRTLSPPAVLVHNIIISPNRRRRRRRIELMAHTHERAHGRLDARAKYWHALQPVRFLLHCSAAHCSCVHVAALVTFGILCPQRTCSTRT